MFFGEELKECHKCRTLRPLSRFQKSDNYTGGHAHRCFDCKNADRRKNRARPEAPPGHKACKRCEEVKPLDDFSPHPTCYLGVNRHCKDCANQLRRNFLERPGSKARVAGQERRSKRKYRYGITDEEFASIRDAQGGVCAICRNPPNGGSRTKALFVDHDHATGAIRGLLCSRCNTALAAFGDTAEGVMRAVDYLRRHE